MAKSGRGDREPRGLGGMSDLVPWEVPSVIRSRMVPTAAEAWVGVWRRMGCGKLGKPSCP